MVTNQQIAMVHQNYLLFSQVLPVYTNHTIQAKIKQGNSFKSERKKKNIADIIFTYLISNT